MDIIFILNLPVMTRLNDNSPFSKYLLSLRYMKILTLNCQHAYREEELVAFLSERISSLEYDAILLQELNEKIIPHINSENGYSLIYNTTVEAEHGRVTIFLKKGYDILYKEYSIFETEVVMGREYYYEIVSVVFKDSENKEYIFSSLHMPAYLHIIRRIRYLQRTMRIIKRLKKRFSKESLVVVGGDWNSIFPYEKYFLSFTIDPRFRFIFPKVYTYHTNKIEPGLFMGNFFKVIASMISINYILDFFLIGYRVKGKVSVEEIDISDHNPVTLTLD